MSEVQANAKRDLEQLAQQRAVASVLVTLSKGSSALDNAVYKAVAQNIDSIAPQHPRSEIGALCVDLTRVFRNALIDQSDALQSPVIPTPRWELDYGCTAAMSVSALQSIRASEEVKETLKETLDTVAYDEFSQSTNLHESHQYSELREWSEDAFYEAIDEKVRVLERGIDEETILDDRTADIIGEMLADKEFPDTLEKLVDKTVENLAGQWFRHLPEEDFEDEMGKAHTELQEHVLEKITDALKAQQQSLEIKPQGRDDLPEEMHESVGLTR